jgi:GR25 family glycosyltransferase involved in LPS biosynthesis
MSSEKQAPILSKFNIFVINLEDRKDRLDSVTTHLNSLGLEFQRIQAVSSKDIFDRLGLLSPAAAGCWHSHILAMKEIIDQDLQYGIVAEDDILVSNPKKLYRLLENPEILNIDMLQIGWLQHGIKDRLLILLLNLESILFITLAKFTVQSNFLDKKIGSRLRVTRAKYLPNFRFVSDDFKSGGHFYLISNSMAQEIVSLELEPIIPIDSFLAVMALSRRFRIYRLRRSLVSQTNSISSIKGK